jgi:hypothetical protein
MTTNRKPISVTAFADELYNKLCLQLETIELEIQSVLSRTTANIDAAKEAMNELRLYSSANPFESTAEEILFFKQIKPRFYSKLIYYLKVFQIETRRPNCCKKEEEQFLHKEMQKLSHFFENNIEFYQYYRTGASYLDETYFLRGSHDLYISLDPQYFNTDPKFSTSHDYKLSKLIAYEQLRMDLDQALANIHGSTDAGAQKPSKYSLHWTGSKTALIELLYALQSAGVFNNGAADVKQIAACLQETFQVELGNYYRTFQEIRIRKGSRTQFLEQLTKQVIRRMDETDELIR